MAIKQDAGELGKTQGRGKEGGLVLGAVGLLLLGGGAKADVAPPLFPGLLSSVSVPGKPLNALVLTDFNRDGKPDVIAALDDPAPGANNLAVLTNRGNGTFDPPQFYSVVTRPYSLAVGDFNGDGYPDVAVGGFDTGVSILFGRSDGTLGNRLDFPITLQGGSVQIADVDGDQIPDLVVASNSSVGIRVYPGNGDGTFGASYTIGPAAIGVRFADLDGDRILDVIAIRQGSVAVAKGLGGGAFGFYTPYSVNTTGGFSSFTSCVVTDLNGDGRPDIAASNDGSNSVSVLLNLGDGTFAPKIGYTVGSDPRSIVAGDFDGDGIPDLLTANNKSGSISVLRGNGDGTFRASYAIPGFSNSRLLVLADLDLDNKRDLLIGARQTLAVLSGGGSGQIRGRVQTQVNASNSAPSLTAVDLNRDGRPELISTDFSSRTVSVRRNNGDRTFGSAQSYAVTQTPIRVYAQDVNGDGKPDIVTLNNLNSLSVFLGNGDGTLQAERMTAAGTYPKGVCFADFNGDGKLDAVPVFDGQSLTLLLGNNDGTFSQGAAINDGASSRASIAAGDFDGDGKPDLAVGLNGMVRLLHGNGNGTFTFLRDLSTGLANSDLLAVDLNGDGRLDLVVTNVSGGTGQIGVLMNRGGGFFAPTVLLTAGASGSNFVSAADFNHDGILDLIVSLSEGAVGVFYGQGNGSFSPVVNYVTSSSTGTFAVADFDLDTRPDVMLALGDGSVLTLYNQFPLVGFYGLLAFEQIASNAPVQPVRFEFRPAAGGTSLVKTVSVPAGGAFALPDVPAGNYLLHVKGPRYLASNVPVTVLDGFSTLPTILFLRTGDANNNNLVDVDDLTLVLNAYNSRVGDGTYFAGADLNLNGRIDVDDLTLLLNNYNTAGAN